MSDVRRLIPLPLLLLAGLASGCSHEPAATSTDPERSRAVVAQLDGAARIHLKKAAVSWGDSWTVEADGQEVATIRGKALSALGDSYSMFAPEDVLVGSESEQQIVDHKVDVYDYSTTKVAHLDEQLTSLLYRFRLSDADGRELGTLEQKPSLAFSGDITDVDGAAGWHFAKEVVSIGAALNLERRGPSKVSALNAIWMTLVAHEVQEAETRT